MGRVDFRRPWPPLQAPRTCLHGSREGRARGDEVSSVLALPCCRCCGSVGWGGEGAEGASATGSEEPSLASPAATGAGGARRACPLLTWWPSAWAACVPKAGIDAAARHGC